MVMIVRIVHISPINIHVFKLLVHNLQIRQRIMSFFIKNMYLVLWVFLIIGEFKGVSDQSIFGVKSEDFAMDLLSNDSFNLLIIKFLINYL